MTGQEKKQSEQWTRRNAKICKALCMFKKLQLFLEFAGWYLSSILAWCVGVACANPSSPIPYSRTGGDKSWTSQLVHHMLPFNLELVAVRHNKRYQRSKVCCLNGGTYIAI